jgi:hypothetical protein
MPTRKQRLAYAAMTLTFSVLISSGFAIWYTGEQGQRQRHYTDAVREYTDQQNRNWCEVLGRLTRRDPRSFPDPTTPAGIEQRREQIATFDSLRRMRTQFKCE